MIKKIVLFCVLFSTSLMTLAGTGVEIVFNASDQRAIVVHLQEVMPRNAKHQPYKQELAIGTKRSALLDADIKTAGFFMLSIISEMDERKAAYNSVIYLVPGQTLKFRFDAGDRLGLNSNYRQIKDANNSALFEVHEKFNGVLRTLYDGKGSLTEHKAMLMKFYHITDTVVSRRKLSPVVQQYLKFKAFDTYNTNLYRLALDANRGSKSNVPVAADYVQPADPLVYFKDPLILLFPNGVSNVIRYLEVNNGMPVYKGRKSLEEINLLITFLKSKVSYPALVDEVTESLLSGYASSYRVGGNFDQDLQAYTVTANQISDVSARTSVKKLFENLRYTMKGAALPDLKFEKANGEMVSLDQFKGKYLFIDLWASWCVPCIKMTPFVQQLEKAYEGKNIHFVAISIDANKQNWLDKMKELNLHGHQFLDLRSNFAKLLNVSGIPHYLIYDPEGKLVVYKADMPNNPKLKETLDQLLNQ